MADILEDFWNAARFEIARVEQRVEYRVPEEREWYEKYLGGEASDLDRVTGELYAKILETTNRGVAVQRIRVFDIPLPQYQQHQIEWGYLVANRYGQKTWALSRPEYQKLVRRETLSELDFWAFDRERFLVVQYDGAGDYAGEYAVTTDYERRMLKRQVELLFQHAIPLEKFLRDIGYVPTSQ